MEKAAIEAKIKQAMPAPVCNISWHEDYVAVVFGVVRDDKRLAISFSTTENADKAIDVAARSVAEALAV